MSTDAATSRTLHRLRESRAQHGALVRWLALAAPVLLVAFVVAAFFGDPAPATSGRGLVVAVAVVVFMVSVVGRNATADRTTAPAHLVFVAGLAASAVALLVVQSGGPGAAALLLAVLCVARVLPRRFGLPFLVAGFVVAELLGWATNRSDVAILTALAGLYGILYLAFRLAEANREAEHLVAELEASRAVEAASAGLAERQRVAREMHDVLAHSLSGLLLQLEGARMLAEDPRTEPRLAETVSRAHHLARSGLDEARRAIGALRDDDLPGPEGLVDLAARFQADRAITCRLEVAGERHDLPPDARVAIYRVAQEALTNIARHARPERVEVRLSYDAATTRLVVEDFTPGPAGDSPSPGGGYGLTGMRERAALLGGSLNAAPTATGFRVELEVPV